MLLATCGLGVLFYVACSLLDGKQDDNVKVINELLKTNLTLKSGEKEIYPFIKSHSDGVYTVELQQGFEFAQLEKLKGKIENAIKRTVSIHNDNFIYTIKLEEITETPSLVPFELVKVKEEEGVKLAVGRSGNELVYLDFANVPHLLVGGATGWGKSIFIRALILQILHNYPTCELELFDFKAGIELRGFSSLKQTKSFIIKPQNAAEEIERIYEEIEDRFDRVTNANCRDIFEYNAKTNNKLPYKFVIIEEFTILLDIQKDVSITLTKALAIARAVGVYFVFSSQRFSADIIDSKIKANIDSRVCFHVADAMNSKIILDTVGAEKLQGKGRAILSQSGQQQEFQSFYVTSEDVQRVTKPHVATKKSTVTPKQQIKEGALWE